MIPKVKMPRMPNGTENKLVARPGIAASKYVDYAGVFTYAHGLALGNPKITYRECPCARRIPPRITYTSLDGAYLFSTRNFS